MSNRAQQLAHTRVRIMEAATKVFADLGFNGASTRNIAARAGANQGLITYHFKSKDALWRAATNQLFTEYRERLQERMNNVASDDPREAAREYIREFVRFSGRHPEFFHTMVEEGKRPNDRMRWLVETHIRPLYDLFKDLIREPLDLDGDRMAHFMYMLIGAGGLIFANAPECRALTGLKANSGKAIEEHAEQVAQLFVP